MGDLFSESYLKRYSDGALRCSCGREHRLGTRRILLGEGVNGEIADLLAERYGTGTRVWVLSDENTEKAAGAACKGHLSRFRVSETVLPARPRARTTPDIIRILSGGEDARSADLVLSVGGGTVSDIGKKVSHILGVPNWCVATAPSVDAYSSGTSALKLKDGHRTERARPSELIFADLAVLEQAPEILFLSGVGDLLAKYLSYLDWNLSALITGEFICEETARLCLDSAREALEAVRTLDGDRRVAVRSLTDAILLSGLAMQAVGASRPASSAEHTISHFWEIAGFVGEEAHDLHGLLVGLSCFILLPGYRAFYEELPALRIDPTERAGRLAAEPGWERALVPEMERFRPQIEREMGQRRADPPDYHSRLRSTKENQASIASLAVPILSELDRSVAVLQSRGFPFRLADYKLDPEKAILPVRWVRCLRNRYSSFDLIHEVGAGDRVMEVLEKRVAGTS
jgi:glycerol-1-phosphate dehydrogenase [NAD(P)+]